MKNEKILKKNTKYNIELEILVNDEIKEEKLIDFIELAFKKSGKIENTNVLSIIEMNDEYEKIMDSIEKILERK